MSRRLRTAMLFLTVSALGCEPGQPTVPEGFQGIVEYETRTLAFELPGRLSSLAVHEGMEVHPGGEIAKLDDTLEVTARGVEAAQAKAAQARVALLEAGTRKEDVRALRSAIHSAQASEKFAQQTLDRQRMLAREGAARASELDAAEAAFATAKARRAELDQQLMRALHGARPEEIEIAVAEADAANAAMLAHDERIRRHALASAHDGYVLEVHREEGEFVNVGAPVATIADVSRPYVDMFVPQAQIDEPSLGRAVVVQTDALEERFSGRVEWIGRRTEFTPKFLFSERERPNLVVRVRVRIEDPDHHLRAGVPAFVTWETP